MTTYSIPPTVLYVKQHSVTKLKYFGKTTQDPYKYNGSGVYWTNHIKKHGRKHIITDWVSEPFTDSIAISEYALAFSRDNNIVESKDWANQIPENGLDGGGGNKGISPSVETLQKQSIAHLGKTHSTETRQKISDARKGKTHSAETKQKMSDARKGKTHSAETKQKISDAKKGREYTN